MPEKLCFPVIRKLTLKNFSLFSRAPLITAEFRKGVFCLAGANGLGKSTFLLAVNFGLTGIVPDPSRKFESVEEYYRDSIKFSSRFFQGRISERDRSQSEVALEIEVGKYVYQIARGMFEPNELRLFNLLVKNEDGLSLQSDYSSASPKERNIAYTEAIARHVGLDTFEQLVFLQHFVFTFDERRELLFWNSRVLERVIYLAFGVNPEEAQRADEVRRDYEKADSSIRNTKWQATQLQDKVQELESQRVSQDTGIDLNDLKDQHRELTNRTDEARQLVSLLESESRDIYLQFADWSAKYSLLRSQYDQVFADYFQRYAPVSQHPLVVASLKDFKCGLCGTEGEHIAKAISDIVRRDKCPLCGSDVRSEPDLQRDELLSQLQKVDELMSETRIRLDETSTTKARLDAELEKAKTALAATVNELDVFERSNREIVGEIWGRGGGTELDVILQRYKAQIMDLDRKRETELKRREKKSRELEELRNRLGRQYLLAEEEFVTKFRELATSFLGLHLDIRLETQGGMARGVTLLLDINNTPRRQQHHLSESQRFFLDIALRMALAQYLSSSLSPATLYIDTPEGSLDIAYESRAGDMFANFVEDGYSIVMTANINTSQLLLRLAERCGQGRMNLHRMTSWTELSEVQRQEEELFEMAYNMIESALVAQGD